MPHFFNRFSAATLAFVFAFSSVQFSAENYLLFDLDKVSVFGQEEDTEQSAEIETDESEQNPTGTPAGGEGGGESKQNDKNTTTFSTLGKAQSALTAQEMRGYQSLYEMQAELFAECVVKLKRWDGSGVKTLAGICAEEKKEMNEQGPQRFLLPDATTEQTDGNNLENLWWDSVIEYWFSFYEDEALVDGLLPPLNKFYAEGLSTPNAPTAKPANADLKKALENWYGRANGLGGSEFLWHYLVTKNQLHAVPFQQGIVTINNCPNPSAPIFANQDCVKTEWKNRTEQLKNQRVKLIGKIKTQLSNETESDLISAKVLVGFYAVDDTELLGDETLKQYKITASTLRNPLQLDIQKLSFLVGLLGQLAKYSATVAYQLELKDSSGGMGIYGNFSTTNAGVDIAQITNLSGKENMRLSQTISKLSNTMVIIGLAIMIPIIVYAGFLMVLSGYDYEQYEKGNEMLWKVLPWAVFLCACRLLVAAWLHVLSEAFRPIASF